MASRCRRRRSRSRLTLLSQVWLAAVLLHATSLPATAQSDVVIGSVAIQTQLGPFFVALEEDNEVVRPYARAFAALVRDRAFFHESDKRLRGCTANDDACFASCEEDEACFACSCDMANATSNCLGEAEGSCPLEIPNPDFDPNDDEETDPEFLTVPLPCTRDYTEDASAKVLHAGVFHLDEGNELSASNASLAPLPLDPVGQLQNDALTVAFVREGSDITPEWIINLEDNSDLFDDAESDPPGARAYFVIGRVSAGIAVVNQLAGLPTTDARCNASLLPETNESIRSQLVQLPVIDPTDPIEPDLIDICSDGDADHPACLQPDCITLGIGSFSCDEPLCYAVTEKDPGDQTDDITHRCDFPVTPSFPIFEVAEPSGLRLVNNGLAPPEPRNTVDYPNNPQLIVDLRNLGCVVDQVDPPGACANLSDRSLLEVRDGGSIAYLRVSDTSQLLLAGGEVGVDVDPRVADPPRGVELFGSGGAVVEEGSVSLVVTHDASDLSIEGGSVATWDAMDDSTGIVSAGDVAVLDAAQQSLVRLVGDAFEFDPLGSPAARDPGLLPDVSGVLRVTPAAGASFDVDFVQSAASTNIVLLSASAQQPARDTVPIGDPGNAADPDTGLGSVAAAYVIQQREVSNADYVRFLNAVARLSDPRELWDDQMASAAEGGITRNGAVNNYSYEVRTGRGDQPVVFVSRFDAMRYANWLHNGEPVSSADAATEGGSYRFVDGALVGGRQPDASFVVPTANEWYKAAYYSPGPDPGTGSYLAFPTGSDTEPFAEPPTRDLGNEINAEGVLPAIAPLSDVGAYAFSASPYGTLDQGGNVLEWLEDDVNLRGGHFGLPPSESERNASPVDVSAPDAQAGHIGIRLVLTPEPATNLVAVAALLTLLVLQGRSRRV